MAYQNSITDLDRVQIQGFQSFFLARLKPDQQGRRKMTRLEAFATAIVDTSDDVFKQALRNRPEDVQKWIETTKRNQKQDIDFDD